MRARVTLKKRSNIAYLHYADTSGIFFNMFYGLIDGTLADAMSGVDEKSIIEVRLRVGCPLVYATLIGVHRVSLPDGIPYVVTRLDIERCLGIATDFSLYSANDNLVKGYLVSHGVRIGVAGEGVCEDGKLLTVKNVTSMVLRIPHEIKGVADTLMPYYRNGFRNTLVVSPPSAGKTTLLRDMARQLSALYNVLVIDERYELSAAVNGESTLDLGESEVICGVDKTVAYENSIRAMSPQIIITDELFRQGEVDAVLDVMRSGVYVSASVHATSIEGLRKSKVFCALADAFDIVVTIEPIGKYRVWQIR